MRIAQVVAGLGGAGLEKMVADLSISLRSRGHDVQVFNLGMWGVHADRLEAQGITVHRCPRGRIRIPMSTRRLQRPLASFGPDVLHAHSGTWYQAASARRAFPKTRLVFTDHGRYPSEEGFVFQMLQRWSLRAIDSLVAVSTPLAEHIQRLLRLPRVPVIENGIDLSPYARRDDTLRASLRSEWGVGKSDSLIVVLGRLEAVKNHQGLFNAVARAANPSLKVAVIGIGSLERQLQDHVATVGIASAVRFLGYRTDVAECLLASDIFVMPSHTEGLPLALLEGMAAGLPIVASPVGGIPSTLGDDYPDWLLPPAADHLRLASALSRLAQDAALRRDLGDRMRVRAGRYSLEHMTSEYEAVYRSCIASPA